MERFRALARDPRRRVEVRLEERPKWRDYADLELSPMIDPAFVIKAAEGLATVLGLISATLLSRGQGWGWPLGTVMVALSFYVYLENGIYGTAYLQLFFLFTQLVGWWRWAHQEEKDLRATSRRLSPPAWVLLVASQALCWWGLQVVLVGQQGSWPAVDAFVTVGSIFAQLGMVYGFAECWLLWFAVNLGNLVLAHLGHLPFFVLLYVVFLAISVNGWWQWRRHGPSLGALEAVAHTPGGDG